MARARLLKPDFFDDEKLCDLPFGSRLAFAGLWTESDREGRLEDRPVWLAQHIFPYDSPIQRKARKDFPDFLQALVDAECVRRYEVDGQALLWIPHFKDHQKIHEREAASVLPPPPIAQGAPRFAQGMQSPPEAEASREAEAEAEREEDAPVGVESLLGRCRTMAEVMTHLSDLATQYQEIDVPREYAAAVDWLAAGNKRKSDYLAFFRNWLRRKQDDITAKRATSTNGRQPVGAAASSDSPFAVFGS